MLHLHTQYAELLLEVLRAEIPCTCFGARLAGGTKCHAVVRKAMVTSIHRCSPPARRASIWTGERYTGHPCAALLFLLDIQ